ncbi:hypothetical protein A7U60_g3341 [Sanghuangporus baumii]|uniref:Reverse transcriptase domain-containing protein n=1 Tax=Sanghuangporus baumii TaxID=108892 RepID=A0A9Q5I1B8_SANBA|nr:hypothetical protein A7U60_g3341 [Sanghuangporus baumii]
MLPDESEEDDDDFEVYEDLFVRRTDAQAGELREEEWIQTAIKNEANNTEAVWDVVSRCAAEVWHEGIEDAEQFIRRAGGKELDAFISIIHPKVAGDDEVNLLNPGLEDKHFINAHALIDSGCTGSCIDEGFVKRYGFLTQRYIRPRPVFNADGTSNEGGLIKEYIVKHNPEIDWKIRSVKFTRCPDECDSMLSKEEIDDELQTQRLQGLPIVTKQEAMREFIEENLASGHIRQSKSPMASPFFFIKKEDGSLRAIQDYRKLNKGMVKNKYPLPLINELIDKVKDAKYITKLDVRWGYYNI